jgi:anti-sigma B factor antagonist
MKYSIDKKEKYTIFTPHEESLNLVLAPSFRTELYKLHSEEVPNLILDLKDVKFVDSSGLSAILTGYRLWKDLLGSLILTGVDHQNVKKMIEISQLGPYLTIIPTLAESIEYVFMEDIERELGKEG